MAGACFVVSGEAGTSDEICTAANGNVGLNVPPGNYTVTAKSWPEGIEPEQTEQTATVQSGETTTVTFRFRMAGPQTGTLVAYVVDAETGNEIPNTCFNVSGLGQLCDGNDPDARMTQTDVPAGDYQVAVEATSLPEGYEIVGSGQTSVTVEPGGTAEAVFQAQRVAPKTGSLRISVVDNNGQPVAGACVDVSGPASGTVCDNDEADQDKSDAQILVTDIPPGSYSVSVPAPPEGFQASSVEQATVQPGEEARVTLTVPAVPTTGTLIITKVDEAGMPLAGACFSVGNLTVCDNGDGDADPADGVIRIEGLDAGRVRIEETQAPPGYEPGNPTTARITAGEETTVEVVNSLAPTPTPAPPPTGSVRITKVDQDNQRLGGSCFTLQGNQTYGPVCDNGDGDADNTEGRILVENVEAGTYTVVEETAPEGYAGAEPQQITVRAGELTRVTVRNSRATGTLTAYTVDDAGNPVGGVCYEVTGYGQVCDQDGDGDMTLPDSPAGDYTVRQVSVPAGYQLADPQEQQATVTPGGTAEVTFTSPRLPGAIKIVKTDAAGNPLGGACFAVDGGSQVCDNGDGDADDAEGTIRIEGVTPGQHTVSETQAPEGYDPGGDEAVTVAPGETVSVTFVNRAQVGAIRVRITDGERPVSGACVVIDNDRQVCDNAEGDSNDADGTIDIRDVPPGRHTVAITGEVPGFQAAEAQEVDVPAGGRGTV
ncbi:MAG: hypothetical protein C4346_10475, partial [Chloroflexota bacterium]